MGGHCEQMSIIRECLCCHELGAISQKMLDCGNDIDCETMRAYRDIKLIHIQIIIHSHLANSHHCYYLMHVIN